MKMKATKLAAILSRALITPLALFAALKLSAAESSDVHTPKDYPNVLVLRNLAYGTRLNLPNEGEGFGESKYYVQPTKDEWGNWNNTHETGQTYDLYYPSTVTADTPIFVFVHGGAYVSNIDKGTIMAQAYDAVQNKGVIIYSMNYIMPQDYISYQPPEVHEPNHNGVTISDMVRDVDAMISHVKSDAAERGFNADRLVLWGESAGAHLAQLYAYDEKNPSQLGLGLQHELPVKVVLDMAGPVDLTAAPQWLSLAQGEKLLQLFGIVTEEDQAAKYTTSSMVTSGSTPTVLCYNNSDELIPLAQYTAISQALETAGVPFLARLNTGLTHGQELTDATSRNWAIDAAIGLLNLELPAGKTWPAGYTYLPDGLTKIVTDKSIIVTDYFADKETWMKIDLEFGSKEGGSDWDGKLYSPCYFMGLGGLPNGHMMNGCIARYRTYDSQVSFWCDTDISVGFEDNAVAITPCSGRQTLKFEYGQVSFSNETEKVSSGADQASKLERTGKTEGPLSIFGCRYLLSSVPYQSREMTVYSWKIYESESGKDDGSGGLKRAFYPVTETASGERGLYDVMNGKFFPLSAVDTVTMYCCGGYSAVIHSLADETKGEWAPLQFPKGVKLDDIPPALLPTKKDASGKQLKLAGFFSEEGGNGTQYFIGGKSLGYFDESLQRNPVLYANWVNYEYHIDYQLAGGKFAGYEPTTSAVYGSQFPVYAPERKGYRFIGWTVTKHDTNCAQYSLSEGGELVDLRTDPCNITCDGDIWVKNLLGEEAEGTVTLTAQWEIALPPEYEKLDCLDNGINRENAGFVQVTGFKLDVTNAVAITYCINDTSYQWQNLFFSHHIENDESRTEFGLCYPNAPGADPMSFHHGFNDAASLIKNADVSDKNVTNTLVLAETGSTFNGSPILFGGTQPSSLAGRSLLNDLLIFCSDDKTRSDGYPYDDSGSLCGPALVKIFSFRVMANGVGSEVILDLVPAKRKAGDVEGFYDVVNGGFYPLRHRCASPTEIASHAVETWHEQAATESECGYKCGVCTDCLMRISQMILPTQPTRSWPYDGANHKPTISNTNDVMERAGCTVTYSPAGEWKAVGTDYTVTYALTPGHVWSDGTTADKTISYSIVRADGADFYVTADADGSGNGSSWASPFTFQEALNAVKGAAKDVTNTIYMKVGTYTNPSGPWTATINPCFIRVLGGYLGVNFNRSQTDYSVLDGENAHGLVNLTVSRGSSTGSGSKSILFDQIEFRNGQGAYRIKNNDLYNYWSQFNHCRFIDNFVPAGDTTTRGSAIEVEKGSGYSTGTMVSWVCVENCEFRGNKSCSDSATTIYSADKVGDYYAGIKLSHSLFVGNSAKVRPCVAQFGGSYNNNVTIKSCTFAYNAVATDDDRSGSGATAAHGGLVLDEDDYNGSFDWNVSDTIFYGNRCNGQPGVDYKASGANGILGTPKPRYLLFEKEGAYDFGTGVDATAQHYIFDDPLFATPQTTVSVSFDGNYIPTWSVDPSAMDVHLQSKEGRWNGSAWVNDTVDSPALDAGDPKADYSFEPVSNGARINLGAYGNTAEASKSKVLVALDANGGPTEPDPAIVMVRQGEAMPTLTDGQKLSRPGYVFLGYGDKQWEARLMTGADTDICNEGTTVFAKMAAGGGTLNAVEFKSGLGSSDENVELVAAEGSGWHSAIVYGNEGIGDAYGNLLASAVWNDSSDKSLATMSSTITLKGLTPGNSYLFQFFAHDGRINDNGHPGSREVSVDGEDWYRVGRYGAGGTLDAPSSQWGATFIYRFVATAETETVEVFHKKNSSNCPCAHFNAMQLRDITATDPHKYYNADGTSAKVYPVENGPSKLYAIWKYNIPGDFEILPYLHFDGTHFILTDYVPMSNTWIETEMQMLEDRNGSGNILFGAFEKVADNPAETMRYGMTVSIGANNIYGWAMGSEIDGVSQNNGRCWYNTQFNAPNAKWKIQLGYLGFTMSDGLTVLNGEERHDGKTWNMNNCFPCHTPLAIGGCTGILPSGAGSPGYGTSVCPYGLTAGGLDVYSFNIYESETVTEDAEKTLVHNFIPVRRTGDDKEGFYDVVGGGFYPLKTETVVTLDRKGGDSHPTNYVYAIAGEKLPSPIDVPTRGGYEFLGYNDQEDGKGTMYYNADGTSNETLVYPDEGGPAMLYAQWEIDKYHVINPVSGPEIVVNYEWLTNAYGSGKSKDKYQQELFTTNQYGVVNWQAYILGYDADERETAAILEESVQNTNPETVTIRLRDWEAREKRTAETGCTLKYTLLSARTPGELMTDGGTVVTNLDKTAEFLKWPEWSFEAPLRDLSDKEPVNYYRIKVHFIFGGGGEVLLESAGVVTTTTPGWTASGNDMIADVTLPDSFAAGGKYLKVEFKGAADYAMGLQAVIFLNADGKEISTVNDGLYTNDRSSPFAYTHAYRVPVGASRVQVKFTPSTRGSDPTQASIQIVDVVLSSISEADACAVEEAAFNQMDTALLSTVEGSLMPSAETLKANLPGLVNALKNGTEYKILLLTCPMSTYLNSGLLEEMVRNAFPGSKIKFSYYTRGSNDCAEYFEADLNESTGVFSGSKMSVSMMDVDCIMMHSASYYRITSSTYHTDLGNLIDKCKRVKSDVEFVFVSPLYSVESRFDWGDVGLASYEAGPLYNKFDQVPWPYTNKYMDQWVKRSHPTEARTNVKNTCSNKAVGYWELYDVAYDYVWRSKKPIGWFNQGNFGGYQLNERGRQLNVHILIDAFKRLLE